MHLSRIRRGLVAFVGAVTGVGAVLALSASPAAASGWHHHGGGAVYVSSRGSDDGSCGSQWHPCREISQGVAQASAGGEVVVWPGTYKGGVMADKQLSLRGFGARIDASGSNQGIWLNGPGASGSSISGFSIQNATGEGILLTMVDGVTVRDNHVSDNDKGAHGTAYPPCEDQGPVPGDCGEAIHLQGTTNSEIVSNRVDHNIGGVLVTDEAGATHDNVIAGNIVVDNAEDCGITMPAHVPGLGVTHNLVEDNFIARNGGAGALIATPGPGMAVTDNTIRRNIILNNGEGGVQMHSHAPSQTIDDNTIEDNIIGTNNLMGDSDSGDMQTTGIIVFSAVVPVHGTVIRHNAIVNNAIGIWLSPTVDTGGLGFNFFGNVGTHVHQ